MKKSALLVLLAASLLAASSTRADSPIEPSNPTPLATLTNAISLVSPVLSARGVSLLPTLRWGSTILDAASYQVNLSTNTTFSTASVIGSVTAPTTAFTIPEDKKLLPGHTYYWRIGVYTTGNAGHLQYYSKTYSFMTIPELLDNVTGSGSIVTTPAGVTCGADSTCRAPFPLNSSVMLKATSTQSTAVTIACSGTAEVTGTGAAQKSIVMTGSKSCAVRFVGGETPQ
jgi:hypothetical protein